MVAYLYSIYGGKINKYKGQMMLHSSGRYLRFLNSDHYNICAMKPGVIFQKHLWFPEENDEQASKIFSEHLDDLIYEKQEEIKRFEEMKLKMNSTKGWN